MNDYHKQYSRLTFKTVMKGTGKPEGLEESVREGRAWFLNSSFGKLDVAMTGNSSLGGMRLSLTMANLTVKATIKVSPVLHIDTYLS